MHEWALAEAVGLALYNYAKQSGIRRFKRLIIGLGELQAVDKEVLELALGETLRAYGLELVECDFVTEEASFECRSCGFKWKLGDLSLSNEVREAIHFLPEATYAYVRCPKCGSPDYSITSGRGLSILGVEY
ncbi:MAG: hydrogenase nickel incorporation protein HypA [Sulfolobales archaeon]